MAKSKDKDEDPDKVLAEHLEMLTKMKRSLLDLGEQFVEERPDIAHLLLQISRSVSLSSRRLVTVWKKYVRRP